MQLGEMQKGAGGRREAEEDLTRQKCLQREGFDETPARLKESLPCQPIPAARVLPRTDRCGLMGTWEEVFKAAEVVVVYIRRLKESFTLSAIDGGSVC